MAQTKDNRTTFQKLTDVVIGLNANSKPTLTTQSVTYNMTPKDAVLYTFNSKEERDMKMAQLKQQKLLTYQWKKSGYETSMEHLPGAAQVKVMYRDADLMAQWPEIGRALEIISEEATTLKKGKMLNIYSKSPRIKSILEDLFVNRLNIHTILPEIFFDTCKYGNDFRLLNINGEEGVLGWRKLPTHQMVRLENGLQNVYGGATMNANLYNLKPDETKFIWEGHNEQIPFLNWQVAHFRLIRDSIFLPYGCVVGDTRIETINGYKEIKDISIGDEVITFNPNTQEKEISTVTMGMSKGVKDVYELRTRHNSIEATDDHKFLVYDMENGGFIYKELGEIHIGDLLVIDNSNEKCNNIIKIDKHYPTSNECNQKKHMEWWEKSNFIPNVVDEKFAKFFGFMLGDGWLHNNLVCFATGEYNKFNKEFFDYLYEITHTTPRFIKPYKKLGKYDISQVTVSSKALVTVLKRMGFISGFDKKRIPSWVYSCNDKIKKAFLDGLLISDGSLNIDKYNVLRCQIEMSNEQLVKDIKILAQSLGYKTSNVKSRNRIGKTSTIGYNENKQVIMCKHISYYFYFYETHNKQEKKYDIHNRLCYGFKTEKVINKTYIGKKETFDITIENKNSNFFANGIVTHNCSVMNSARRFWRILSMMEDAMLLHRIEKSIERRIYKVNVGAMDQADVQTFLDEFANTFKRAPIVDPKTGQIDLRKNFLDVNTDYFIPVRDGQDPTSIEVLQGLNSQLQMEDVQYMQNKLLTAMGVPKNFLNYQDSTGKQQNLSIQDIRFCRSVNYYQQVILMELNKIAIIHLYLLGFYEDLTNFTLSLNNPSNQIEMMELDNMAKRLTNAATALAEQGGGIPLMSWHQVQKEIMGRTDDEIATILDEVRLEKAIAAELMLTTQIIKKTNIFDRVDRIYGEPGAEYDFSALQPDGGGGLGGGGGAAPPMGGGGFGDDLGDLDAPGGEDIGDLGGEEESTDLDNLNNEQGGGQLMEIVKRNGKSFVNERLNKMLDNYIEKVLHRENVLSVQPNSLSDNFITNEGFSHTINELKKFSENKTKLDDLLD